MIPSSTRLAIPDQPLPLWIKASVVYLFLPLVIFTVGWLKLWISIPLLACALGSVGVMLKNSENRISTPIDAGTFRFALGIGVLAVGFAILCGLCPWVSWVPQSTDYVKHNLILGDLIERPWPVRYPGEHGERFLCYGLGYYLVPAAVAKLIGSSYVGMAGFLWATLGLFLFFYGLGRSFSRYPKLGIGAFLLCSGLSVFWYLAKRGFLNFVFPPNSFGIDPGQEMMLLGLYTSNMDSFTRILYQPQHAIAGWLGGVLIYDLLMVRNRWTEAASVLSATFFWGPLTALGLAVIGVVALTVSPYHVKFRPIIHIVAAIAMVAMLVAYYLPHVPLDETRFIWKPAGASFWVPRYLVFLLLFAGIPVSAIWYLDRKQPYLGPLKPVVVGMTLVLMIAPLYVFGQSGDLRLQISGAAFLFIAIAMAKGLIESSVPKLSAPYLYLTAVFLAGAVFPVFLPIHNLIRGTKADYRIEALRKNHLNSILDLTFPGYEVTCQYLGDGNSPSARWILKSR